jgi:hypothetical protein
MMIDELERLKALIEKANFISESILNSLITPGSNSKLNPIEIIGTLNGLSNAVINLVTENVRLERLESLLESGFREYCKSGKQEKRAVNAIKAMGFDECKAKPERKKIETNKALIYYFNELGTISRDPDSVKWEALEKTAKAFEYASAETCLRSLRAEVKKHKDEKNADIEGIYTILFPNQKHWGKARKK